MTLCIHELNVIEDNQVLNLQQMQQISYIFNFNLKDLLSHVITKSLAVACCPRLNAKNRKISVLAVFIIPCRYSDGNSLLDIWGGGGGKKRTVHSSKCMRSTLAN